MAHLAPERVRVEQRAESEDLDTGVSGRRTAGSEALRGAAATSHGLESARRLRPGPGEQRGEEPRRGTAGHGGARRRAHHGWCRRRRELARSHSRERPHGVNQRNIT